MSITPSPIPRPERESSAASSAESNAPSTPTGGGGSSTSLQSVILLVVLILVVAGGLGFYSYQLTNRLEEMKTSFDQTSAAQNNILQAIGQRMDAGDERYADLQGEFSVTRERLGLTRNELQRARQISAELAERQRASATLLTSQLGQLQQEQVTTQGSVGT
ncbi:MAG: hypothetical protein O7E51_17345, partial [Acidobacteria bacterium]|nr:hypothetical protein [Acidobacteriota bacterium]